MHASVQGEEGAGGEIGCKVAVNVPCRGRGRAWSTCSQLVSSTDSQVNFSYFILIHRRIDSFVTSFNPCKHYSNYSSRTVPAGLTTRPSIDTKFRFKRVVDGGQRPQTCEVQVAASIVVPCAPIRGQ